ncbi:MAG: O-antigen ligase family protein [Bacteroidota bacterium]
MTPLRPAIKPNAARPSGRWLLYLLLLMMGIRISSYFTLFPGSVAITQVVKVGLRFAMTGLSLILLKVLQSQSGAWRVQYQRLLPFSFYALYLWLGILSIFWTTNVPFTLIQLAMTCESLVFVLLFYQVLCYYEVRHGNGTSVFSWINNRSIFVIGLVFMGGIVVAPETFFRGTHGGEVHRLGGFIINPNELGMLAVLGLVMVYLEFLERRNLIYNALAFVAGVAVLLLTQSRSSLGAFVLVSGIFVLLSKNYWVKFGSIAGAVLALPIVIQTIILKQGDVEEVMSMTGRLPFWSDLISMGFPRAPLLGFGFMSISPNTFSNKFDSIHAYAASMTHNTFVQVLINLGLVGAFIVFLQMLLTFQALATSKDAALRLLAGAMLIPLIINSTTEFGIFGESNYGILFYQFIILFFTLRVIPRQDASTTTQTN